MATVEPKSMAVSLATPKSRMFTVDIAMSGFTDAETTAGGRLSPCHADDFATKPTTLAQSLLVSRGLLSTGISDSSNANAITIGDAVNVVLNTSTGTKIGTATTQKLAFFNSTPVVQQSAIANITATASSGSLPTANGSITIANAASATTTELLEFCVELESKLESALAVLRTFGFIAT
mgnify:CR=1 FL=1